MFFYTFLPKLLNMSLTASVVILFVLLLRLMLKKAPKVISYALWGIVLFRLLCPVSVGSEFSLFGFLDTPVAQSGGMTSSIQYVPNDIVHAENPDVVLPLPPAGEAINGALPRGEEQLAADPLEAPMAIATYAWMAGVLAMAVYAATSYGRLRRKLITASPLRDNIYLADEITSPFVMGLLRPKIYLPSAMEEWEQPYIILHEQHHIRRFDHVAKALAFIALCIHWFNPLVWVAFVMAGKDMEMSCDEAVVRKMGPDILADYTASLLSLATGRRIIAGMPLAFGEGDTKGRIRNLASWRKPAFWAVLAAAAACVALAVCLLTNPQPRALPFELENIEISWAKAVDCRPDEPTSFDLNDAELEELKFRLADFKIGKRDDDLGGFTPFYSIGIEAEGNDFHYFSVQGFDADGKNIALCYQGEYYRIDDDDFSAYLRNICAGGTRAYAENTAAVQEWVGHYRSDENDVYGYVLAQYSDMVQNDFYSDLRDDWNAYDSSFGADIGLEIRVNKQDIYYAFYDIDGNGTMELIIAAGVFITDGSNSSFSAWNYDLYGYNGADAVHIFPEIEFGYRTNFALYEDGVIEVFYSVSAAQSGVDFYRIGNDGFTPELVDSFVTDAQLEGNEAVFVYSRNGNEISEEEYNAKIQSYEVPLTTALDWVQIR